MLLIRNGKEWEYLISAIADVLNYSLTLQFILTGWAGVKQDFPFVWILVYNFSRILV